MTVYEDPNHPVILEPTDELTGGKLIPGFAIRIADIFGGINEDG